MNYYLDTEFHEYKKETGFLFKTKTPTIDLISIGIVSDDGREYYAISTEFDLNAAWKNEWLRKNVLKSIFIDLFAADRGLRLPLSTDNKVWIEKKMTRRRLSDLIFWHGKTRSEIASEIKDFIKGDGFFIDGSPKFYAYYADYDWVVFCWLFGRMIDLPKGFPMYCIDLKQTFDEKQNPYLTSPDPILANMKTDPNYPKQTNEHNAIADAKWNRDLHRFLILKPNRV